ncbi:ribosomal protein L6, alpha-beta domain-containing protein [Kockovaella imperatae]|uniref:Ribosomal protein L6, alpha-beta domain-containing protein n=1 Tax=Kockovaella imperatae TaxID=4999 RepID=A0A1Y1UIB6_9TREE|nr:ribosomal protein L6, alpha-beta domain-containing protein [Kockovaella imperatae]ORX37752.1 ribosomal protein L6, alpha-beta domain-containing protein [Kockovaella imperatae]
MMWKQAGPSRQILTRCFHATASNASHIGILPVPVPPSVSLTLPPLSIPPDSPITSETGNRVLTVAGPLGTQFVLVHPPVILRPPSAETPNIGVSVHDPKLPQHRSLWGFTRSMINNAVVGVSEGYKLDIRLVGVGYRASMEPIPPVFLDMMKRLPPKVRALKPGSPPPVPRSLPTHRLNLKLGYSHPVLIDIPSDIKVEITAPTTMVLSGTDKNQLGLFAATIRRKRKPEPYRGKGIFVGGETIKLKEVKKK